MAPLQLALTAAAVALLCAATVNGAPSTRTRVDVKDDPFLNDTFPAEFKWGTATSSYQIEGAWNVDGKGENIWDKWCHEGGHVYNNDTGDIACDSYNLVNQDIANLQNTGVDFYRFSISWSRILPTGKLSGGVNEAGVEYYNNLINGLLTAGIEPFVTLYHWDLPQPLQDDGGGWLNPNIVQYYNDYATVCFQRFGDRVKRWLTMNEPWVVCWLGYGNGVFAPGVSSNEYLACHNLIKAHAAAWHTYDNTFRQSQSGLVSITLDSDWKEPLDQNNPSDVTAAERALQFKLGWLAHPIFINGDYPEVMKERVAAKSAAAGLSQSRLPEFTEEEKLFIRGTHDFFGLNHYSSALVVDKDRGIDWQAWDFDRDVEESLDPSWPGSGTVWLKDVPWGLRKLLGWIRDEYGNPPVVITENGVSDDPDHYGKLADQQRIRFYQGYINNVLKAVKLDGCNVIGYTAWSLMDNFEWGQGYSETFGMHRVDFSDPSRPRTPKDSVSFFKKLIADNGWPQQ